MTAIPSLRPATLSGPAPGAPAEGTAPPAGSPPGSPSGSPQALGGRWPALGAPARLLPPRTITSPELAAPGGPLALAGLDACVGEALQVARLRDSGPPDPATFGALLTRVARAGDGLPEAYRQAVVAPLVGLLRGLGPVDYRRVLEADPARQRGAGLLLDLCQAVLQRGEGHAARATRAFQEVVSDLYAGFGAAAARRGVPSPEGRPLAPVVRWGRPDAGPYTWPATESAKLDVGASVVSLPAANAAGGLLAWAALGHETAGHAVLSAHPGLSAQLGRAVERSVSAEGVPPRVGRYLGERIEEVASDVLGVLAMGPSAAVGLIGYVRALEGAWGGEARLGSTGRAGNDHPASILRAFVAAEAVRRLPLAGAGRWADRLVAEASEDLRRIRLAGLPVSAADARAAAAAAAEAVMTARPPALGGRSLAEVHAWGDADEATAAALRRQLAAPGLRSSPRLDGFTAGHAVAAAVQLATSGELGPGQALDRLLELLDAMQGRNPAWRQK